MRSTLVPTALLSLLSLTSAAVLTVRSSDCGVVGYDKANPKAVFFRKDDAESATFEGCQTLCKANSRCVSFAIGNGECLLYPTSIGDNVRVDSRSPFTFFAADCSKPEPPKPKPSPSPANSSPASPVAAVQVTATATNAPGNTNGGTGGSSAPSTGNGPANQNQNQSQNPAASSPTGGAGSESSSGSPASSSSSSSSNGSPASSSASPDAGAPANKPNAASSVTAASGFVMGSLLVLQMLL